MTDNLNCEIHRRFFMRFIRILLIAITGTLSWGLEGMQTRANERTVFDLPPTEYWGLGEQITTGDDALLYCILKDNRAIIFPVDGRQPTTENAVQWSCATVDADNGDSPITEWYMKMFGVINKDGNSSNSNDNYINAGWDKDGNQVRLISFPADSTKHSEDFTTAFRKIASTGVGRVLLYRILIEVRRRRFTDNVGCFEQGITSINNVQVRNASRSIIISFANGNSFKETTIKKINGDIFSNTRPEFDKQAKINFDDSEKTTIVVGKKNQQSCFLYPERRSVDIALFHEMCHWYHFLRNTDRLTWENAGENKLGGLLQHTIGQYFYRDLDGMDDPGRITVSAQSWGRSRGGLTDIITYEEMRNILGAPKDEHYIEGDDLSENLYRAYVQTYMCFSHSDDKYFEDASVVDKARRLAEDDLYMGLQFSNGTTDDIDSAYLRKGLGECRREVSCPDRVSHAGERRWSFGEEQG